MPAESAADRAAFLDLDDFGEAATYTPVVGAPVTLNGIYDAPHEGVELGGGLSMTGSLPSFKCRSSDLPAAAAQGDSITVDAGTFAVKELQPDGTGMTVLQLTST